MAESINTQGNTPSRNEKGQFTSPDGTETPKGKKKPIDPNVVQIKVIKEKRPLPPKNFKGKLEDVKERTAINFLKSVIARRPNKISIDGNFYYSSKVVAYAMKKYKTAVFANQDTAEKIHQAEKSLSDYFKTVTALLEDRDGLYKWKSFWKGLAIGLLAVCIVTIGLNIYQRLNRKTVTLQLEAPQNQTTVTPTTSQAVPL